MKIGIPKEIKNQEHRVSTVPGTVRELVSRGHEVFVENNAGIGCGFDDLAFIEAGATILDTPKAIFEAAQLIIKVKEPQPSEVALLKPHHILFTYLHLAAEESLAKSLTATDCTAIAYETVIIDGKLPLLEPMSEVAGRMSTIFGATHLAKHFGGNGNMLSGVPGVSPSEVVVIGGGTAGTNAAKMALGLGAKVTILEISADRMRYLDLALPGVTTLHSNPANLAEVLPNADLVIGAVLVPGAAAPKLVNREHLKSMKNGSVIVDIAVDQGGCVETTHATTHENPTYIEEGVIHYCVANMPAAFARTSTLALTGATRPWTLLIADLGALGACEKRPELWGGVNCINGKLTCKPVANAHNMTYTCPQEALKSIANT